MADLAVRPAHAVQRACSAFQAWWPSDFTLLDGATFSDGPVACDETEGRGILASVRAALDVSPAGLDDQLPRLPTVQSVVRG